MSLRRHLIAHIQELESDPDRLLFFIENGKINTTTAVSKSFEYSYNLQLILTDFAGSPNDVMLPLLDWLYENQHELLANYETNKEAIQFDAEILSNSLVDLSISLPLTERVLVTEENDQRIVKYLAEPKPLY